MLTRIGFGLEVDTREVTDDEQPAIHIYLALSRQGNETGDVLVADRIEVSFACEGYQVVLHFPEDFLAARITRGGSANGQSGYRSDVEGTTIKELLASDGVKDNLRDALSEALGRDVWLAYAES